MNSDLSLDDVSRQPGVPQRIAVALSKSIRHNAGLLLIIAVFVIAGFVAAQSLGSPVAKTFAGYFPVYMELMPFSIAMLLAGHAFYLVTVVRPKRPIKLFLEHLRDRFATIDRISVALPLLIFVPLFGGSFTLLKASIPDINPFSWDPYFHELDVAVHFGTAPWELLQPVFGHPIVTFALNWFYNLWFFVLSAVWVWQAFSLRNPRLRLQFFYTLLFTWILLGVIAAGVFSSVGPCFYGRVVSGPSPYSELMSYLYDANKSYPVWSLGAQVYLWNNYVLRDVQLGSGISAMPSLHIAMSFLFVLVGFRTARWLGLVFLGYFAIMLIGSVHLAWHYAIDGYAGVVGVAILWWLCGKLARRSHLYALGSTAQT